VIEGADGPSFRVIKHPYAADNTHVYLSGKLIDKAESTTFKVHSDYFAEDANDFYWNGSALNVRDKATFQLLGNARMWGTAWAKDRYNAYYLPGGIITDIDYKTFHPVRKKYFGNSEVYAADKYRVFFKEEVVPGADPKTFKEIDYHTGHDKNRVYDGATPTQIRNYDRLRKIGNYMYSDGKYIYDSRFNVLPDADARTFKSISNCWYKDKNNVWWDTHLLPEANPRRFKPVTNYSFGSGKKERLGEDFNYGKDERNVFFQDSIISEADVDSFEIINFPDGDSWTVFDRNRIYQGTDSPQLQKYLEEKYGDSEIKKGFKFLRKFGKKTTD
ncbi:MAG: DKNYY domain-containing protein, partial [Muribaculaceae bacterium]|nr:DKNYY domain-containing protein [Muribaculaceae bacterium]